MATEKKATVELAAPTYEQEMASLRNRLAGRPYCREVKNLLPDMTKATIHGAVNGRNENALVLSALKIVVHKMELAQQTAENRLAEVAQEWGVAA